MMRPKVSNSDHMKRAKLTTRTLPERPCIKIYTTAEILRKFAERAESQNRSMSKHGEFLVKQDLAVAR